MIIELHLLQLTSMGEHLQYFSASSNEQLGKQLLQNMFVHFSHLFRQNSHAILPTYMANFNKRAFAVFSGAERTSLTFKAAITEYVRAFITSVQTKFTGDTSDIHGIRESIFLPLGILHT